MQFNLSSDSGSIEAFLAAPPQWGYADVEACGNDERLKLKEKLLPALTKAGISESLENLLPEVVIFYTEQPSHTGESESGSRRAPSEEDELDLQACLTLSYYASESINDALSFGQDQPNLTNISPKIDRDIFFEGEDDSLFYTVDQFYREKKYRDAAEELKKIEPDLSSVSRSAYDYRVFLISTKTAGDSEQVEERFQQLVGNYAYAGYLLAPAYLHFIKYLEDTRKQDAARERLKTFQKLFPESILPAREYVMYLHLEGRGYYYRGEFNSALERLNEAAEIAHDLDPELFAMVCNTAVNAYADNLYLSAADILADTAYEIRERYQSPEIVETRSLMGQLEFRRGHLHKSAAILKNVLSELRERNPGDRELNRALNYCAKVLLADDKTEEANGHLEEAEALNLEPRPLSFTRLYRLIYYLKIDDPEKAWNHYQEYFAKNNAVDYDLFCFAWASVFLATECFSRKQECALDIYSQGIQAFLDDAYYLEAAFAAMLPFTQIQEESASQKLSAIIQQRQVFSKLEAYVDKHSHLQEAYFQMIFSHKTPDHQDTLAEVFHALSFAYFEHEARDRRLLLQQLFSHYYLY